MNVNPSLKDKLTLVVLGRSGSGKGTQAAFLVRRLKRYGVKYISTGDLLRQFRKNDGTVARYAARVLETGGLIPAWLVTFLWSKELIEKKHYGRHLVFDGAPRRLLEAELLDEGLVWLGRPPSVCVYLDVDASEVTRRLLFRGRADDTKRVIRNRLAYFPKYVLPVIKYYHRNHRFIHINGEQTIEKVQQDIDRALAKRFGEKWPKK